MNFKVYIIGDKVEKFYSEIIEEYAKRLSRYCKIKLIVLKNREQLRKKLSERSLKIYISPLGESLSSEKLSESINNYAVSAKSDISFIIDSENVDLSDLDCDENLALSVMSMSSGLQTSILYEQIYRAYRILNNEPYHK